MTCITINRSEVQRLTSLLHSKTIESPSDNSLGNHGDKRDDFHAAIATPVGTSRVSNLFIVVSIIIFVLILRKQF